MKKRIISALMAVAMCVSALPLSVYAEENATVELPEFTQKFIDEVLLDPDESEENRLIHNLYKSFYDSEDKIFLGVSKNYISAPYYMQTTGRNPNVPKHDDIKCIQYISKDNDTFIHGYIENQYITEKEFYELNSYEQLVTTAKIFDETDEMITGWMSTCLAIFPRYFVGEDGKAYNSGGKEIDVFNGEVMTVYLEPEELEDLYIYDGESVFQYADVYHGVISQALRTDFYKYLEDNDVQQVFKFYGEFSDKGSYCNITDYHERSLVEDLSAETIITDKNGNIIPNDPDFLRIIDVYKNMICVYKTDDKYVFEDELGDRIVFSSFND
ncbi:MAG: hypothetical protein K2J39_08195, partial [Ruminococcus sp.]|nr:hypothetical protein [Ruminococcus sp.]